MANGNGAGNSRILDKLFESLNNRIVLLLVAAFLGTTGGILGIKVNPDFRADGFTGTNARQMRLELEQEFAERFQYCKREMRELRESFDHHRDSGAHNVAAHRLSVLEAEVTRLRNQMQKYD